MIRRSDDCSSRRVPFGVGDPRPLAAGGCGVAVEHDRVVRQSGRVAGDSGTDTGLPQGPVRRSLPGAICPDRVDPLSPQPRPDGRRIRRDERLVPDGDDTDHRCSSGVPAIHGDTVVFRPGTGGARRDLAEGQPGRGRPAVSGIAVIVAGSSGQQTATGNLLAIASGLAFAAVIVSLRHLRDESPIFLVLVNQSASCLVLLPWLAWHPPSLSLEQWLLLAAFGIVQMSIPYLLFARGLKSVSAQEASLIALLEPVLTPVWVMMAGWETAETVTWIGGGLIVGGLLLRYTAWAGNDIETPRP